MTVDPKFGDTFEDIPLPTARAASRLMWAAMEGLDVPQGTVFLAADDPQFGALFAVHAFDEGRPVLLVLPNGVELLYEPRSDLASRTSRWFKARFCSRRLRKMGPLVVDESEWADLDIGNAGFRHRVHHRGPVAVA